MNGLEQRAAEPLKRGDGCLSEPMETVSGNVSEPLKPGDGGSREPGFMAVLERELDAFQSRLNRPEGVLPHTELPAFLCGLLPKVDFRKEAGLGRSNEKLAGRHLLVTCVEKVMEAVAQQRLGACSHHGCIWLYNGAWWGRTEQGAVESFLGAAAETMGIDRFTARHYLFREQLMKQFLSVAPPPPSRENEKVLINLMNGTFEIGGSQMRLRRPERDDFLTYRLPFGYEEGADCPRFDAYLNTVLPERSQQLVLLEYLGYLFVKPRVLKLEKTLILYGTGANGKSVLFEIVNALLGGSDNVSHFSLQNLTNENGYYRAMLGGKLVNYASEMTGRLDAAIFKQLVSGEPVDARLPYGEPFTLSHYGKLIFNCNELPRMVEHTHAFFRRFLIIPFGVTIPEEQQDRGLAGKIIASELPGVLNRVLAGLQRLLQQRGFTHSEGVELQLQSYREETNSVALFMQEERYGVSTDRHLAVGDLYAAYRSYCLGAGCHAVTKRNFTGRLRDMGIIIERKCSGMVVCVEKNVGGTGASGASRACSAAGAPTPPNASGLFDTCNPPGATTPPHASGPFDTCNQSG